MRLPHSTSSPPSSPHRHQQADEGMLRAVARGRWSLSRRRCSLQATTSLHESFPLLQCFGTSAREEEKEQPTDGEKRMTCLAREVQLLIHKHSSLSKKLVEVTKNGEMEGLLDFSLTQYKRNPDFASKKVKTEPPTVSGRFLYLALVDFLVSKRSPSILRVFQQLDGDPEVLTVLGVRRFAQASLYVANQYRLLVGKQMSDEDRANTFLGVLFNSTREKAFMKSYFGSWRLAPAQVVKHLSFHSPKTKPALHLHVISTHLVRALLVNDFNEVEIVRAAYLLHMTLEKDFDYDCVATATMLMHAARRELESNEALANSFVDAVFMATCVHLMKKKDNIPADVDFRDEVNRLRRVARSAGLLDNFEISLPSFEFAADHVSRFLNRTAKTKLEERAHERAMDWLLSLIPNDNSPFAMQLRQTFFNALLGNKSEAVFANVLKGIEKFRESDAARDLPKDILTDIVFDLLSNWEDYPVANFEGRLQLILNLNRTMLCDPLIAIQCARIVVQHSLRLPETTVEAAEDPVRNDENDDSKQELLLSDSEFDRAFDPNLIIEKEDDSSAVSSSQLNIESKQILEEVLLQLIDMHQLHPMNLLLCDLLDAGWKIDPSVLQKVFSYFLEARQYLGIIDLFDRAALIDIPRTYDMGLVVIEALANLRRFNDCWRSINALQGPISSNIRRTTMLTEVDQDQLMQRTRFLVVFAGQSLQQLSALSHQIDIDEGKTKINKTDLVDGLLFSVEMVLLAHSDRLEKWDWSRSEYSQDLLVHNLITFKAQAEPAMVLAVFDRIRGINSRAASLIDYVSSIDGDRLPYIWPSP